MTPLDRSPSPAEKPAVILDAAGDPIATVRSGRGPIVAFALHAGHVLRPEIERSTILAESDRLREEDPFTASMAPDGLPLVEVLRSRFEVDLNRPRERAVYRDAADAWGMDLYAEPLPDDVAAASLAVYDRFYEAAYETLSAIEREHGYFVVLDLHSYNHRRDGAGAAPADVEHNPEVNLGTGRIDIERWKHVIDGFMGSMTDSGFDCRENVKFHGGHFSHWVTDTFPTSGVALAIEFKKTFMDEWTGQPYSVAIENIRAGLSSACATIADTLAQR